jgi:hypothetical protein
MYEYTGSPIVIVHGGAARIRNEYTQDYLEGIQEAANAGYEAVRKSALDAVQAAVICMENNPVFNAGEFFKRSFVPTIVLYLILEHNELCRLRRIVDVRRGSRVGCCYNGWNHYESRQVNKNKNIECLYIHIL